MPDPNKVEIEISAKATGSGIKDAAKDLANLKKETVDAATYTRDSANPAAQNYTDSVKKLGVATEKTASVTRQAKDAIKGLGASFPELARAAQLAINTITLSFTAIVGAIAIFREKLADGARDLERHKGFDPEYVNRAAEAWNKYATAVSTAGTGMAALKANLDAVAAHASVIERLGGKDNPLAAKIAAQQKASAQSGAISNARITAQNLRRDAARIAPKTSAERDANTVKKTQDDAAKAAAANEALDKELALVNEAELINSGASDNGVIDQGVTAFQYGAKYGAASPASVRATLEQQRASNLQIIARAEEAKRRADANAARRSAAAAATGRAGQLESQAASLEQERGTGLFNAQVSFGVSQLQAGNPVSVTPTGVGPSVTPAALAEIQKAYAELQGIIRAFSENNATLRAYVENMNQRNQNQR